MDFAFDHLHDRLWAVEYFDGMDCFGLSFGWNLYGGFSARVRERLSLGIAKIASDSEPGNLSRV